MTTLAQKVKDTIDSNHLLAFSLYAGTGVVESAPYGKLISFPQGVELNNRTNDEGRCVFSRFKYADDSVLEYRYNKDTGYKIIVK